MQQGNANDKLGTSWKHFLSLHSERLEHRIHRSVTTNFGDGAVSRYSIGDDGSIALEEAAAGLAVDGQTGLRDEDLSGDGRFLYAIDADSRRVFGWAVGAGGSLSPVGSWQGLPATVAGLAAS